MQTMNPTIALARKQIFEAVKYADQNSGGVAIDCETGTLSLTLEQAQMLGTIITDNESEPGALLISPETTAFDPLLGEDESEPVLLVFFRNPHRTEHTPDFVIGPAGEVVAPTA